MQRANAVDKDTDILQPAFPFFSLLTLALHSGFEVTAECGAGPENKKGEIGNLPTLRRGLSIYKLEAAYS